jgi:hypothetical protein
LIVGWLPNSSLAASMNQPSLTNPGGASADAGVIYTDQQLVDITAAKQQQLNSSDLAKLKRELSKEGWKATGKAFLSGGKWLLKFTRTVVNGIIVLPGMYVDKAGQCVRYSSNKQPVPGSTCGAQG